MRYLLKKLELQEETLRGEIKKLSGTEKVVSVIEIEDNIQ